MRVVVASGFAVISAALNLWVSVAAGILAIILSIRELGKLWQRRRHRQRTFPNMPRQPAPLPLTRVSRDEYMAAVRAWELYGAQIEQYFKDQRDPQ